MKNLILLAQKIDAGSVGVPETDSMELWGNLLDITYYIAGAVAVIVAISAGLLMILQSKYPELVQKRKDMLAFSLVGLVIIASAFTITRFVLGRF